MGSSLWFPWRPTWWVDWWEGVIIMNTTPFLQGQLSRDWCGGVPPIPSLMSSALHAWLPRCYGVVGMAHNMVPIGDWVWWGALLVTVCLLEIELKWEISWLWSCDHDSHWRLSLMGFTIGHMRSYVGMCLGRHWLEPTLLSFWALEPHFA